jgi:hypothetical protein
MKYLERIGLIGAVNTILIAAIPYFTLLFKWDENVKTRAEQIVILSTIVLISLLTFFFSRRYQRNIARVEGFAWGYFYNFIYEVADLVNDREANIIAGGNPLITADNDKEDNEEAKRKYLTEFLNAEIKMLIIIPNDLHADYRFSEILATIFDDVMITPAKNGYFPIRDKQMKHFVVKKNGKRLLLLIDTPPTTMRAIKLYQESCCNIDHNDAFKDLDEKAKKNFDTICSLGRKNIAPVFKKSLFEIIRNLTKGSKNHRYEELIAIMTIDELTAGIINKGQYESLSRIGDNLSRESTAEKNKALALVNSNKSLLLNRLTDIMAKKYF